MSKPRHDNRGKSGQVRRTGAQRSRPATRTQPSSFWRGPWPIVGVLGGIVVLIVAFVLISRLQSPPSGNNTGTAESAILSRLAGVSPAVIDAVGTGGSPNPVSRISGSPLRGSDGKPEVLYIGAEWCPYCAAQRWALAVALSHFGSLKGVGLTTSSSSDVFPDTRTLTFYRSTFSSSYIDFAPVELQDRNRNPQQSMTAEQQQLFQTYNPNSSIPFIDLGNAYLMVGQGVPPDPLQGKSWQQIADALSNAGSPITIAVVGNSNYLTAAMCKLPGASAAPICSESTIKAIVAALPS